MAHPAAGSQLPISTSAQIGSGAEALTTGVPTDGWQGREGDSQDQAPNPVPSPPLQCWAEVPGFGSWGQNHRVARIEVEVLRRWLGSGALPGSGFRF